MVLVSLGCGGDDSPSADERQIRFTMKAATLALAREDFQQFCDLITDEIKTDWEQFARRHPDRFSTRSCPTFAKDFYGPRGRRDRRKLRSQVEMFDKASIRTIGDTAIITVNKRAAYLERVGGRWLLTTDDVYVTPSDAEKVTQEWADSHQRPGDEVWFGACSTSGEEPLFDKFGCSVEFRPGGRWRDQRQFTVFLRTINDHREVKIVTVLRGSHPGADPGE